MRAGRGNQPGEPLEQLEGGEPQRGAAVGEGPGRGVDESGLGPPEVRGPGGGVEAVQREGGRAIGVVVLTSAVAAWIPARRASRVDPREVLSAE